MSSLSADDHGGRRARSRWFDPRLATGVALVVASVAGVVAIVSSVDRTVTVYSSEGTLAVGDVVTAGDLVETEVRPGPMSERYLRPGAMPDAGVTITRTVGSGELIPAAAVGDAGSSEWASIVVAVTGDLPRAVGEGAMVDVWAASDDDEAPGIIATGATVVEISQDQSMVAGSSVLAVELIVPRDRVARILQSKSTGDFLSLVPAFVPLGR